MRYLYFKVKKLVYTCVQHTWRMDSDLCRNGVRKGELREERKNENNQGHHHHRTVITRRCHVTHSTTLRTQRPAPLVLESPVFIYYLLLSNITPASTARGKRRVLLWRKRGESRVWSVRKGLYPESAEAI